MTIIVTLLKEIFTECFQLAIANVYKAWKYKIISSFI